ncbi:hypothetical protein [Spirosoma fluviale]|uniref:Uncharacterized protein n=1 Tax=Spirosoma fluviale TaxID=1597977 RepID=A0A286FCB5_9BACT|nr:hypothetical protein [Spirosoma fluviale]SOD80830.1 hypothetical protein SAMN06269250_1581 [Spirosoma fluviale]
METKAEPKVAKKLTPFRLSLITKKQISTIRKAKGFASNTQALEFALEIVAKALEGQEPHKHDLKAIQRAMA